MPSELLSLRFPEELLSQVDARSEPGSEPGPGGRIATGRAETLRRDLSRYYDLLLDGRRRLRRIFAPGELFVVAAVTNGWYTKGDTIPLLNPAMAWEVEEWLKDQDPPAGVDGAVLVEKLTTLDPAARAALLDAAERFWLDRPERCEPGKLLEG